ncbi:MAG TPA: twin-arginine translocase subunit TatC [Anaerolineales bacterium]|nr:twin-arginine translocase subunit TatC [Anaerolineales bacterium]
MRKLFSGVWKALTYPFRIIYSILAFPFRKLSQFNKFLNTEPEESPITEVFIQLTTNADTRQMLWDQIEALRMHLLRAVLSIALTVSISFFFTIKMINFLAQPIGGLDKLTAVEVTESISVFMKVALLSGIAFAVPYIAFELWLFAAPGLKPRERKMGLIGIPLAAIFFLGGAAFTFYIMLPAALPFLNGIMDIKTELRPQSYFSFVTAMMLWVGISFEFPLVIYALSAIGLIKPQILAQQWRLAIVIIAIVAAAITPTIDPVNQGLVMAPMILLYFISIGLSYIAYAGRKPSNKIDEQKNADEDAAG